MSRRSVSSYCIVCTHLKALHESPEENPDGVSLSQQLDQAGRTEQTEETDIEKVFLKSEN